MIKTQWMTLSLLTKLGESLWHRCESYVKPICWSGYCSRTNLLCGWVIYRSGRVRQRCAWDRRGNVFSVFQTVSANNCVTDGPEIKSIPCIVSRSFVAMCVDACLQGYLQGWGWFNIGIIGFGYVQWGKAFRFPLACMHCGLMLLKMLSHSLWL